MEDSATAVYKKKNTLKQLSDNEALSSHGDSIDAFQKQSKKRTIGDAAAAASVSLWPLDDDNSSDDSADKLTETVSPEKKKKSTQRGDDDDEYEGRGR